MKKVITGLLIVTLVIGMTTGCGCSKKEEEKDKTPDTNNTHGNTNEGVIRDQEVEGLKLTNTALVMTDGVSQLTTLVTNDTDTDIPVEMFDIIAKDAAGNVMVTMQGYVGGLMPAHTSREIVSSCSIDLTNATEIEYKINN